MRVSTLTPDTARQCKDKLGLVSMVDGHLFDVLSSIAQSIRKKTELPFGGIQVHIATGPEPVVRT